MKIKEALRNYKEGLSHTKEVSSNSYTGHRDIKQAPCQTKEV